MLLYHAALRRGERFKADLVDAVASGYAGCQSKEAAQAMERMVHGLRNR